ncbi:response regulator [Synergistaceae bacterium OttesenSCG-928-I11]|nr:response regulator [Synergistaceae bacterium OttesenSCG-928-I11]
MSQASASDGPAKARETLRLRTVVLATASFCLFTFLAILFFVFQLAMTRMLIDSENDHVRDQVGIVTRTMQTSIEYITSMTRDLAYWEAARQFGAGQNPTFIEDNWAGGIPMLQSYKCNLVVFQNRQGDDLYWECWDYIENKPLTLPEGFTDYIDRYADEALRLADEAETSVAADESAEVGGIVFYRGVAYYIIAAPLIGYEEGSTATGTAVMAYILDDNYFKQQTQFSDVSFRIAQTPYAGGSAHYVVERPDNSTLQTFVPLTDMREDSVVLEMEQERKAYLQGLDIIRMTLVALSVLALFFIAVLYYVLGRLMLNPIQRLSRDIQEVSPNDSLDTLKYSNTQEFVALCSSINGMLDRLRRSIQAAAESRIAQGILKRVLNGMDADIYVSDPDTRELLFINDKMMQRHGLTQDVIGKKCWQILNPGSAGKCTQCKIDDLRRFPDRIATSEVLHDDGTYSRITDRFIEWTDKRVAHLSYGIDITEIKNLERELIAARDAAEDSNRAKSDFLSRMSHEIRTPLNAIIGMVKIARDTDDDERIVYCLEKIDGASVHLLGLINDILDMSKIEAGKFEISLVEFDFEKMISRVVNVINFKLDEKNQHFSAQVDRAIPPFIVSDELRMSQVVTNLLSNANKFTPDGGDVSLYIRLVEEADDNLLLQFDVVDNGIGISPEGQSKLFRSFEQADGSISRKFGGTGLGLAISKRIVDLLGGSLWVKSEEGRGSTFSFTARVLKGERASRALPLREDEWKNLRVLAIDDDPGVLTFFAHAAQSVGLQCKTASGGREALDLISSGERFDVIFVDWKMPDIDGIELTARIKERYGTQAVVIMISSAEWSEIGERARAAGVDRFIPKPLFTPTIVDCIEECLSATTHHLPDASVNDGGIFKGKRILLAEDVEVNREILISLLEDTGVEIDCAENGREALETFEATPEAYDLIFMDIHMPEMDGFEATRRIRALPAPRAATVPIIAMTANVFREDVEKCLAAGMNDHVGKPLDMDEIMGKMKRYLR